LKRCVKYSKIAIRDLDRVWTEVYDASRNFEVTQQYMEDILDKIEEKAEYAESGAPLYYEDSFTGYYFIVFKAYIAFYRIEDKNMIVDRVLLGKSDYMRHLNIGLEED